MDSKKMKQIGFTAAVAIGALLVLNSIAKRVQPVAKLANAVQNGI